MMCFQVLGSRCDELEPILSDFWAPRINRRHIEELRTRKEKKTPHLKPREASTPHYTPSEACFQAWNGAARKQRDPRLTNTPGEACNWAWDAEDNRTERCTPQYTPCEACNSRRVKRSCAEQRVARLANTPCEACCEACLPRNLYIPDRVLKKRADFYPNFSFSSGAATTLRLEIHHIFNS
jgi:hypothetical protein